MDTVQLFISQKHQPAQIHIIIGISKETHTDDLVIVTASETQTDESIEASKGTQTDSLSIPQNV